MKLLRVVALSVLAATARIGISFGQTPATTAPATKPTVAAKPTGAETAAISKACSEQADAKGLHGKVAKFESHLALETVGLPKFESYPALETVGLPNSLPFRTAPERGLDRSSGGSWFLERSVRSRPRAKWE